MILTLKNDEEAPLRKSYVVSKQGLEQEVLFNCEFEGMKITAEVFKVKKKKASIAVVIFDTENNKSELSFAVNTENKISYTFAELPEKTIKKEKYIQLEVLPDNANFVILKYNYDKKDSETNKEWLKDACAKIVSLILLEAKSEKNKKPFDAKEFETLSERLNDKLEDWHAKIKATEKEKDEAAKELSEITGVVLFIDPMSEIVGIPELRYNITTYDEQLERRFVDYKEGMSMKDFLLTKFGEKAVSAAERAFGLKTE